jgi:hypothetical protein
LPLDKAPARCIQWYVHEKVMGANQEWFLQAMCWFFIGELNLESINSSFITLVPKINDPETVNDFRPISLLNSNIKLLTKLLAERLQALILEFLHVNQMV